ncbi:ABC-2 family transporter protein [Nodosilinea sp. P-1105]|uniref:ABC transporter permease n=1 Tax=Nodosilinea sp. P-1105 TaxID=2546229 RepID=UPI00146CF1A4|nr:ABC-2 family transporter protein [Nodosilinea sp. P-1105]NMF85247.1 multidrug ABC transporter permease [Nodosilinea sp. P-1105]
MLQKSLKLSRVMLSVYYAYMVEYRAELLFWVLSGTLPLILMGLWAEAAQGGQFALGPTELVQYFLAVFLVRQFTVVWVIWEFEREVVEGKLSPYLLQPVDPVWRHFFSHVAERFARLPFAFVLGGLFVVLYPDAAWWPTPGNLGLGLLAVILAFCLRFVMQYTFALAAFWTERATAIEQFSFLLYTFLSGMIAPLALFPDNVRAVVLWTPFPYLIYFPASLLTNQGDDIVQGFVVMLLWGSGFFVLNRWLWRRGLRQYSGMGA